SAWRFASTRSTRHRGLQATSGRRRCAPRRPAHQGVRFMASGIRDRVAILGMGCSQFGERWDMSAEAVMTEAFEECLGDASIGSGDIQAAWLATAQDQVHVGKSALPLSTTLRLDYVPVTRVENYCASGTEAFRAAVYAVAAGSVDIALALGVEKLKDTGF